MADGENNDLMKFLERQFEGINKKFESIDRQFEGVNKQFEGIYKRLDNTPTKDDLASFATKDDLDAKITAAKEEAMRHTGVLIEDVKHKLDIVIEGLMGVNEGRDRDRKENEQEHARLEKMSLINSADISKLDQRVGRLEGRV